MTRRNFLKTIASFSLILNNLDVLASSNDKHLYFYGNKVSIDFGSKEFVDSFYIPTFTGIAKRIGVYKPLFPDIGTYDLRPINGNYYCFWHCDYAREPTKKADLILKLVLPENLVPAFEEVYGKSQIYDQPLLWIFLYWCKKDQVYWFLNGNYYSRWEDVYGNGYYVPPTPMAGPDPEDIADLAFYEERPMNCSTSIAWAIIYALYKNGANHLREIFRQKECRYAIDCLSPGMVLWLLHELNLVQNFVVV